jgi:hypothetical protein
LAQISNQNPLPIPPNGSTIRVSAEEKVSDWRT